MVNKVQTLRSSTRGQRPTGQAPGVLWVTYPDNAFGVVDAAGAAFDLLAVRFHSSLAAYVVGDIVKQGTQLYRCVTANGPVAFNIAHWSQIQTAVDATYLPLAGGTMAGPLILNGEPAAALGAATKQTVDLKAPLASPTFTGDPKAPTPTPGDNDTSIATTAFVAFSYAPLDSPVFTGNPTAPTPAPGDSDTSIATTAFVATATGNAGVVVSDTAPAAPVAGKLWFDSVGGNLFVRYDDGNSAQWVVAVNSPVDLANYATVASVAAGDALKVDRAGDTITGSLNVSGSVVVTGNITSLQNFIASSANAMLATTGAGFVYLRPNGVGSATGQMTISSTGNLNCSGGMVGDTIGLGAFSATGASRGQGLNGTGGSFLSSVVGTVSTSHCAFYNANGNVGAINTANSATNFLTTSDERLKEFKNYYTPEEAIAIIKADPVRSFTWKSTGEEAIGWFAQQSYAVDTNLASPPDEDAKDGEDRWGIDYGKRTPYLWAALTGALARIEALEAKLATLAAGAR